MEPEEFQTYFHLEVVYSALKESVPVESLSRMMSMLELIQFVEQVFDVSSDVEDFLQCRQTRQTNPRKHQLPQTLH